MLNPFLCIAYCICLPMCKNKTYLHAIEGCTIIQNNIKEVGHTMDNDYCKMVYFSFSPAIFILYRDGNSIDVGVKDTNEDTYNICTYDLRENQ